MIKGRPPRLDEVFQTYDRPLFFVTICPVRRHEIADMKAVHRSFKKYIARACSEFGVAVWRYVIMPGHIHFFVCGDNDFQLAKWVN